MFYNISEATQRLSVPKGHQGAEAESRKHPGQSSCEIPEIPWILPEAFTLNAPNQSMLHSHKHGLPDGWPWFLYTLGLWPCCQWCCLSLVCVTNPRLLFFPPFSSFSTSFPPGSPGPRCNHFSFLVFIKMWR